MLTHDSTKAKNINSNDAHETKVKLPLPIFVRDALDFIGLHHKLIYLIGFENFIYQRIKNLVNQTRIIT